MNVAVWPPRDVHQHARSAVLLHVGRHQNVEIRDGEVDLGPFARNFGSELNRHDLDRLGRGAGKYQLCEKTADIELVLLRVAYPAVGAVGGEAPVCPLWAWTKLVNTLTVRAGEWIAAHHAATAPMAGVAGAAVSQVRIEWIVGVVSADHRPVSEPLRKSTAQSPTQPTNHNHAHHHHERARTHNIR